MPPGPYWEQALPAAIPAPPSAAAFIAKLPPHAFFVVSAIFHNLGPACAVLLFAHVPPLGVAWLRIAAAAAVFAVWRRPWRYWRNLDRSARRTVGLLGIVLALMNVSFYLAIDRLPLGTVSAIEFLGPIVLAAVGMRTARNYCALALGAAGGYVLAEIRVVAEPWGIAFAFANCALFVFYVVLGHRVARDGGAAGIDRLGASMLIATIVAAPIGIGDAARALVAPVLLAAGVGVGVSSSVVPYVCDQLAMARLPRATFALLLSVLPATAAVIGLLVLHQVPSASELIGVGLVIVGVGIHREPR